jgi:Tripartite ATP-independent periplasmic transporters, DctQ component
MGANGKGNGKKDGAGPAPAPAEDAAKASNGKARGSSEAPAEAAAEASAGEGKSEAGEGEHGASDAPADPSAEAAPRSAPARSSGKAGTPKPPAPPAPRGAAWAQPFARLDERWTWLESRLLTFVLLWQILALVAWVFLNGLSESVTGAAGAVFRGVLLASAAGTAAWVTSRKNDEASRRNLTLTAAALALVVVFLWRGAAGSGAGAAVVFDKGVYKYFDNVKGWLQEGSTLTLLGGLRGLGTRLTLWLALLGGSLATASGKHIHVDVVFRFIPKSLRLPVSILNYLFAATVCFAGVWGFFDHVAIESYGSRAEDGAGTKIENALHHIGNHAFLTRKQVGLDLRTLPHVIGGQRYDQWMSAADWNEWVDGAGFESRWEPAQVSALHIQDGTHPPFVVSPDGETTRGALAHTLGLVFPFGLLAIALRFLLRALLTLSGHYAADPDEAHKEEIGAGHVQEGDA